MSLVGLVEGEVILIFYFLSSKSRVFIFLLHCLPAGSPPPNHSPFYSSHPPPSSLLLSHKNSPMSRSTLSDFTLKGKIGSGSFGVVYLALRHKDSQNYVIKTVPIGELSSNEQMEAINEVKLLAAVNSPYVVKYFDSFVEKDTLYIVMEYCDRGDLKGLLKRCKSKGDPALANPKVWTLFLQMCVGLHAIHARKVLHRDMKTANVFLQSNEGAKGGNAPRYLVKIGDLGVAKLLGTR